MLPAILVEGDRRFAPIDKDSAVFAPVLRLAHPVLRPAEQAGDDGQLARKGRAGNYRAHVGRSELLKGSKPWGCVLVPAGADVQQVGVDTAALLRPVQYDQVAYKRGNNIIPGKVLHGFTSSHRI